MKVFVVGLPDSGRTTISESISKIDGFAYIPATEWIKSSFRRQKNGEHIHQYLDEYHSFFLERIKINPDLIYSSVNDAMSIFSKEEFIKHFVIDGVGSPRDFIRLFDYNNDVIVFANRTDSEPEFKPYEDIGLSVIRDYCYWLSSALLLSPERWIELNFKIPGNDSDPIKFMGTRNKVCIVKSINNAQKFISKHLEELVNPHQDHQ